MKLVPQLRTIASARLSLLLTLVLFAAVASVPATAKKIPKSAWQTGMLRNVSSDTHSRLVGIYNNGHGMMGEKIHIVWQYTIDAGRYIYEADRTTRRRGKPLNVTINGPVKFAVMGMHLYLRDATGKVHKLAIETKTLKPKNGNSK